MSTPEPYPYRQLNYPINNLEQSFTQEQMLQTRSNIGIPSSVNENGKVLTVANAAGELEWATVQGGGGVPSSDPSDEGKVLTVDANGDPSWQEPQGGNQVQSDWTEDDNAEPSYIQHKPTTKALVAGSNVTITESATEVTIAATAEPQVNSDWTASSGAAEILHKPDLSIYAESANLATVATTGNYDDLVNKPAIPSAQVNSDWNSNSGVSQILNRPNLSAVATTGDYNDLQNKPSIPAAPVNADWDSNSGLSQILNKPSLATVATSGDYSDLVNKPSIPASQVQSDWAETDNTSKSFIQNKPKTKVVLVNASTSFSSQRFYWNLTAEQQAKVAGFTNPLVTVQVSLDLNAALQDNYRMQIMVHGVGDSAWYYALPNGINNPNRDILKGIRCIQESSTGCYGYPIDIVMCDFVELTGGVTFPPSPSCTFTLIVEECET